MIRKPTPLFFEQGPHAVILLHAYSGSSNDMRLLARRLESENYTVLAPIFTGHATGDPADILRDGSPQKWWQDTRDAIATLRHHGYQQIAIFGLSLGGLFATRALQTDPQLLGGGTIASPVVFRGQTNVPTAFIKMARAAYQQQQLDAPDIANRMVWIQEHLSAQLTAIQAFADTTATHLDQVKQPVFIAQGDADQMIDPRSGQWLAEAYSSQKVDFHEYAGADHVLTVNSAHHALEADILTYLHTIF
ncbi:alpha/beta hydrolase [Levilactobacillus tujiorum]|uniref:Alpha/beta fold hydrolase n=1 Tax=Levilactobacillus tujiorum TaxID=2912243 RepID=A0ABX1L558_9LACO|nr:alpha/beta fold hydrolase [Levilactobacillus tujiorum]MCH5464490.1 alpha/beta fold hydrolase [Levilactobacillus tujiorum]NLR11510.1 alpha/beta fold hydrolase [Lactobacillus sp. HBUAS51387]NLR29408.1 alpha/beta fold hydrolase [Levilactobacillus tujiorum]NLR32707.1 alpha/beta fold hydrolase [Levilactobacillus tujiorum]